MVPSFLLIHLASTTLTFLFIFPSSEGTNADYTICSAPYSCGNIHGIGYPFWGGDRPQLCGLPDFQFHCRNASVYLPNLRVGRPVLNINTSNHTISIGPAPIFSQVFPHCHGPNWNEPLGWHNSFKFTPKYRNITIFYSCPVSFPKDQSESFKCFLVNGTVGFARYSGKQVAVDELGKSCKTNFTIPVLKSDLEELNEGNVSLISVFKKGFDVEYIANFTACSMCMQSGGACGSSDHTLQTFVCYCRHGSQPLACPKSEGRLELILGLGIGGGIFMILTVIAISCRNKLNYFRHESENDSLDNSVPELEEGSIHFGIPLFTYTELKEATDNFDESKELGDGGFGRVYFGKLKDGRDVAVKRLYEKSYKRVSQFLNEVQILTSLRHCNLVTLYGCTSRRCKELLLVYEYVANGTVADHLYGDKAKHLSLPWTVRLRIAIETASALSYLHASDIIHRDVKTSNILLDSHFSVKVADFGLSRLFPVDVTHVSTAPQGTPGYLDPEYHLCYQLTDKSDVYSFGVVLVELLTSLPAVDMNRHKHEINLSHYAMNRIQRCAFEELVDPKLGFASDFKVRRMTTAVAELAFLCLQHNKDFRPSMDEVLEVMKRIESTDYDALLTDQMANMNPVCSPAEDDDIKLLSHTRHSQSPASVMDRWSSRSTTENTSSS